jgi:predicted RND superfamily exporter protein
MILVEPPLSRQEDLHNASKLNSFINKLRQTADSVEANTPIAGTLAITSDMTQHITHDGPRATLFAFLAVVFLVIVLFRNVKTIALILFSLFLGVLWLAGIIIGCNLKINFLNFIALPITFGIGVDYGVNIFQRYRENHKKNQAADILKVLQHTGGAVGLSSFCTMVGYLSLLIAGNQGFVSFGLLAILGELTCVLAATLVLPAYLVKRRDSTK